MLSQSFAIFKDWLYIYIEFLDVKNVYLMWKREEPDVSFPYQLPRTYKEHLI